MTEENVFDALCELLEVPKGTLTGAEELGSLGGWDSLAIMGLIAYTDERHGVILSPEKLLSCKTVKELAALASGIA